MKKIILRLLTLAFLLFIFQTCDEPYGPPELPIDDIPPGIEIAIQNAPEVAKVHDLVDDFFFQNPLVIGVGISADENGIPFIIVFTTEKVEHRPDVALENIGKGNDKFALPIEVDGVAVSSVVTDEFRAFADPTARLDRPVPIGVSTGHPDITAGTIGCRVKDTQGNVYALSNNHVYANENQASIGDAVIQPGTYDGGSSPADDIGSLFAFVSINFSGDNYVDAAIASTTKDFIGYSTPDGGYGTPSSTTVGATIRMRVQKYGRTTGLTKGRIYAVNATVNVGYDGGVARFVNQIIVSPGTFSAGGDSGSLIVSIGGNNPVGLLFAGSTQYTIANPIETVLDEFGVTIDDGSGPPAPVTDIAIISVSAPGTVIQGDLVDVNVTVSNEGNQEVTEFTVSLNDLTDVAPIGTSIITGLAPGTSTVKTFSWNTSGSSLGDHTLSASHSLPDDVTANNSKTTVVNVSDGSSPSITIIDYIVRTKGANKVTLVWTGGSSTVEIKRNDVIIATIENSGTYVDVLGNSTGTFDYQVCSADGSGCSDILSVPVYE